MKTKIPKSIVVNGKKWTIEICEKAGDVDKDKRECCFGQTDHWTHTIRLYKTQEAAMWETFWHEMFHVFFDQLEEEKLHDNEKLVSQLGGILNDTLIRNNLIEIENDEK
jgi:hypothetical protein